jgi:hypothetical protein
MAWCTVWRIGLTLRFIGMYAVVYYPWIGPGISLNRRMNTVNHLCNTARINVAMLNGGQNCLPTLHLLLFDILNLLFAG